MPKRVLETMEVLSDKKDIYLLPFDGANVYKMKQGCMSMYRAEEMANDFDLDPNMYKRYSMLPTKSMG